MIIYFILIENPQVLSLMSDGFFFQKLLFICSIWDSNPSAILFYFFIFIKINFRLLELKKWREEYSNLGSSLTN